MYLGRFLVVAPGLGAYRVSSRSFPNRRVVDRGDTLTVAPTADANQTDNPYVSYNCVRVVGGDDAAEGDGADGADGDEADGDEVDDGTVSRAVVGNGSHVDPIAEKLGMGYPARDALVAPLLALDYEKDDYDTPRIAGVVGADVAWLGTVRRDALLVREVTEPTLVATYEKDAPEAFSFDAGSPALDDPSAIARAAYDLAFEHPVCAAAVGVDDDVTTGVYNGE